MSQAFLDYFRCPPDFCRFASTPSEAMDAKAGYFKIGPEVLAFGRVSNAAATPQDARYDADSDIAVTNNEVRLPFDLSELAANLRYERYVSAAPSPSAWKKLVRES